MAASEARAAWQRTANRCFVQEDAKRASMFTSCSSSKLQSSDIGGCDVFHADDHGAAIPLPLNRNSSDPGFLHDTRWWLQSLPNFACSKELSHENLFALDTKIEESEFRELVSTSKPIGDSSPLEDHQVDTNQGPCSSLESQQRVSFAHTKHDTEARLRELKAVNNNLQHSFKHKAREDESWVPSEPVVDWNSVDELISDGKSCSNLEMPCMEIDKTEPWWRITNKDDLASLVAKKSFEHIDNCDLPPPQHINVKKGIFSSDKNFDQNGIYSSSLDRDMHSDFFIPDEYIQQSPASLDMPRWHWSSDESCHTCHGRDIPSSANVSYVPGIKDLTGSMQTSRNVPLDPQLLDALSYSQTRAREAEKAIQQAHAEKEHILKLFFRQASHLFAYKQWLRITQLESFLLQLKMKDNGNIASLFPRLPLMNSKEVRKGVHSVIKGRGKCEGHGLWKCVVALVVGLGFVGSGLLLGWTMGWLLPF